MLKHVRVTNFKSLIDVSVDLEPVTVLIGRSGTGKSNFFDGLRFFRDCVKALNGETASNSAGGWPRILPATANDAVVISFSVRFAAPGLAEDYEYELSFENRPPQNPQVVGEKLFLGERVLFHRQGGRWVQPPSVVNPPPANSPILLLGGVTGVREISRAHSLLSNGFAFYTFPDDVLLRSVSNRATSQTGLAEKGENFLETLVAMDIDPQAWDHQPEMVAALRQLNPSIKSVELTMPGREKMVVSHEFSGRILPLELVFESEGFRRLLAHLIALYQTPPKQALFFEEPEKGIHPGALAVLAQEFKACPEAGRGQVVLTSHSPELLDHFEPGQLRVVEIDNYATKIGPVAPRQVEAIREQLLHPGELLTVDEARLAAAATES